MNVNESKMNDRNTRLKRGTQNLFYWTLAWLLSNALVSFGPKLLWNFHREATLIAMLFNLLLGVVMVMSFKKHLEDMDDLQRKIHFNAMAISLGCTMIISNLLGYLKPAGLMANTPSPSVIMVVMGLSYLIALFVNNRKYS